MANVCYVSQVAILKQSGAVACCYIHSSHKCVLRICLKRIEDSAVHRTRITVQVAYDIVAAYNTIVLATAGHDFCCLVIVPTFINY